MEKQRVVFLCIFSVLILSSCYSLPLDRNYSGPLERSSELDSYYARNGRYKTASEELIEFENSDFVIKKIILDSPYGPITIDYYKRTENSESVILVFPILKGKPIIENYFARYLADHGFDSVIIRRQNDFIDPDNIDRLEQIIRDNIIKDRFVIDFLSENYGKKNFGSFGISRGAINAAMTAGADGRLKYNVLVMGGSDLPGLFKNSNQRRIKKYINTASSAKKISKKELISLMSKKLRSDPKNLAAHIDARNTLMFLGVFDRTVPVRYGRELRKQLGNPKTIFLLSDHYASLAFTQIAASFLPAGMSELCILPLDYIETESLSFYRESMQPEKATFKLIPYRILRLPFELAGRLAEKLL